MANCAMRVPDSFLDYARLARAELCCTQPGQWSAQKLSQSAV
jgi:hypothetical protein